MLRAVIGGAMSSSTVNAAPPSKDAQGGLRARLFDADRTDRLLEFDEALQAKIGSRQLLWIDIEGELDPERRDALAARFEFEADLEGALGTTRRGPSLELHGRHFHLRVAAEPDPKQPEDPTWLDLIAGPNLVITRHSAPLRFLEALNERIKADATIGQLD